MRITVIQRLEEYLNLNESSASTPSTVESEEHDSDDDDDDEDSTRGASPAEPVLGMWVDHCKQLFLWYYDIYLVSPHICPAIHDLIVRIQSGRKVN